MPALVMPVTTPVSAPKQRLYELFRTLTADDQAALLRFAEFLAASKDESQLPADYDFPAPGDLERPEGESVIMAIKRLTAAYPMINKDKLLHQTSELMAGHVMRGRAASDVVNELEQLFAKHYQQLKNEFEQNC